MTLFEMDLKPQIHRSERVYRWLMQFYPAQFRQEYGAQMVQTFRDRYKDAAERGRDRVQFWMWILADTVVAGGRQHIYELNRKLNMSLGRPWLFILFPTSRRAFAIVFLAGMTMTVAMLCTVPEIYCSTARLVVEERITRTDPNRPRGLETDHLRTAMESLMWPQVLGEVAQTLNLTKRWAARYGVGGVELSSEEAVRILRRQVHIRLTQNASLIDVRVNSEDRREAAQIANKIVEIWEKHSVSAEGRSRVQVVDLAEPGLRPVRPNVPFVIVIGGLLSGVGACAFVLLLKLMRNTSLATSS